MAFFPMQDRSIRVGAHRARPGFTLVEILIVVIILGILAAIAIPQLTGATRESRENVLKEDLRFLRQGVQAFKWQHLDIAPGFPPGELSSPTETDFIQQMTSKTDLNRMPGGPDDVPPKAYGPYLAGIPMNPINGKSSVRVLGFGEPFPAEASDADGWIYQPATLSVRSDAVGTGLDGVLYYQY